MLVTYVVHSISFQAFFVQAFKIAIDTWKFCMLLLYILWDDGQIFKISGLNEQLQQQLEYTLLNTRSNEQLQQQLESTLLKRDCNSWWISKMQSGCQDILGERNAIKFCFKLGKNATET